jgi:hypothetical protein
MHTLFRTPQYFFDSWKKNLKNIWEVWVNNMLGKKLWEHGLKWDGFLQIDIKKTCDESSKIWRK